MREVNQMFTQATAPVKADKAPDYKVCQAAMDDPKNSKSLRDGAEKRSRSLKPKCQALWLFAKSMQTTNLSMACGLQAAFT
jgi:hypothetical protein